MLESLFLVNMIVYLLIFKNDKFFRILSFFVLANMIVYSPFLRFFMFSKLCRCFCSVFFATVYLLDVKHDSIVMNELNVVLLFNCILTTFESLILF